MTSSLKKSAVMVSLALGIGMFAANANAAPVGINGTSAIGTGGVTNQGGTDLSNFTTLTIASPFIGSVKSGDYTNVPDFNIFTMGLQPVSVTNPGLQTTRDTWNITAGFGTYVVDQLTVVSRSANFMDVYTKGMLTPVSDPIGTQLLGCATGSNTCQATETSLRWSFTFSGGTSYSASGTLSSPFATLNIPEPDSIALFGIGLLALAAGRRGRLAQKSL